MKRMPFVCLFAAWVLFPFHPAEAQKSPAVRKIGFLASAGGPSGAHEVLRRSLGELGYAEGQNIVIEYRAAEGRPRLLELADQSARDKVEVIVASGGPAARSAKDATKTVPIVFGTSGEPVESVALSTWFQTTAPSVFCAATLASAACRNSATAVPSGKSAEVLEVTSAVETGPNRLQYSQTWLAATRKGR